MNLDHPEGGGYVVFSDDFTMGVIPPGKYTALEQEKKKQESIPERLVL